MDLAQHHRCCAQLPRPSLQGLDMPAGAVAYYMAEQVRFQQQRQILALISAILLAGQLDDGPAPFAELVQQRLPLLQSELADLRPALAPESARPLQNHMDGVTALLARAAHLAGIWLFHGQTEAMKATLQAASRLMAHCAELLPGADIVDRDGACCSAPKAGMTLN